MKTILEKWIFFLKHADELEVIPDSANTVALRHAYDIANQFGWTKDELDVYEYWGIKEQDERGAVQYALKTGVQQGLQQGLQQGETRKAVETASKMLAKGLDIALIVECTGLSTEDITALQQQPARDELENI